MKQRCPVSIKISDSLSREKKVLELTQNESVNIYTCGVTVYDECHIGHARSLYVFDVIRRHLAGRGFKVNFVRNITDIDDKIINRANELNVDWRELVAKYIASYNKDLELLGIDRGIVGKDGEEPRATKNIPDMIEYIGALMDKGYAYSTESGVYFNVRKFKGYGKLSGQSVDQMQAGARISPNENKQDPLDFALWKISKEGEPSWDSPWGRGRPGWHIECSVMSQKFLKTETLDIHAGGRDLIFPHHENEIAQAEAATGKPFARYWLHHGLLTINGQKMSKSMGNFVTIKDALKRYPADALKLLYLQAHYSSPVDFSEGRMKEAAAALERFNVFFSKADRMRQDTAAAGTSLVPDARFKCKIDGLEDKFMGAMDDDFNTPQALACLFGVLREANKDRSLKKDDTLYASLAIKGLCGRLGLFPAKKEESSHLEDCVKSKIEERELARRERDFQKADSIREELHKKGITLEDTKEGTIWRRL